jgi:hypothetical protein
VHSTEGVEPVREAVAAEAVNFFRAQQVSTGRP